jgi:hypothetical protein
MTMFRALASFCAFVFVSLLLASPAAAQATRTWVSGVGDDANPCSRTAPCKTFAGAISKTAAGGEIDCLDPGGFGAVTITKSMSIQCDDFTKGGVLVSGTNGITVNDNGVGGIVVVLRGLDFEGVNTGLSAINFVSGKSLTVDDCIFKNFLTAGITFQPTNTSVPPTFNLENSTFTHNASGVVVSGASTTQAVTGTIGNSLISNSTSATGANVSATQGTASKVVLILTGVTVSGGANDGLQATGAKGEMIVGSSVITGNTKGLETISGGLLFSYLNNEVNGNGSGTETFTSPTIPLK